MPNRILKESICSSDSIDSLSWFAEVLFYRLIVNCDDYGRFDGRPAIIKNRLFPLKENLTIKNVTDAINMLASAELVTLYEIEGRPYLYLPTWNEHQTIRAKKSKYPSPEGGMKSSENICKQMRADVPVIQSNTKSNPNPNPNAYSTRAQAREDEQDDEFTAFWNAYPRKSGDIRQAFMAYLHAQDLGATPEMLIEAIKAQTDGVTPEDLHFLPSAEKWLRNRGWESKASLTLFASKDGTPTPSLISPSGSPVEEEAPSFKEAR